MNMANCKTAIFLMLILTLPFFTAVGQNQSDNYPDDSLHLYAMARDLWSPVELQSLNYAPMEFDSSLIERRLRGACLLLEAAVAMDRANTVAWRDLLDVYISEPVNDPGRAVDALVQYSLIETRDQSPVDAWLRYQLDGFSERKAREFFLQQSYHQLVNYPVIQAEILVELGILALEKGDTDTARDNFGRAFSLSKYNFSALALWLELPQAIPQSLPDASAQQIEEQQQQSENVRLFHTVLQWRTRLLANPYDLQAVFELIGVLENNGGNRLTQQYYNHALRLIGLMPRQPGLEEELRLKQLVGVYKSKQYHLCLKVAAEALKKQPDDLLINGIRALALKEIGMIKEAEEILSRVTDKAVREVEVSGGDLQTELAWFFCFIEPDPTRSLEYAQRTYQDRKNDPRALNTLAYACTLNDHWARAEEFLKETDPNDPIAALAWSRLYLARDDKEAALQSLRAVNINRAGILAAVIERELQQIELKIDTEPKPDAEQPIAQPTADTVVPASQALDYIELTLKSEFEGSDLLLPEKPQDYIQCRLRLKNDVFSYADPLSAKIYLTNISNTVLVLGPKSFLDPHIFIAAEVTPGKHRVAARSTRSDSPNLIPLAHRYMNRNMILLPGDSGFVTETLNIGPLREILRKHPQQSFRISFYVFLDPVINENGDIGGRIPEIQPEPVTVTRRAYIPTLERLKAQQNFLREGTPSQRVRATRLLAGLLLEAELAKKGTFAYRPRRLNTRAIRDMIIDNLDHADYRVQAWSAYALGGLELEASDSTLEKLGRMFSHPQWFVRFMTAYAFSSRVDLTEYLRWAAFDENDIVKRQALFLRNNKWEVIDVPLEIPEDEDEDEDTPSESDTSVGQAVPVI
jgi:tetratricopeptide (TPR) repeat protein